MKGVVYTKYGSPDVLQLKEVELLALKEMIEEGKIQSIYDKIYPFEQAAEAHRRVETEQRLGPVVISVGKS